MHQIVKVKDDFLVILDNRVQLTDFIGIVNVSVSILDFLAGVYDVVYDHPVFFDEVGLMKVVGEERKATEKIIDSGHFCFGN